MTGRMKVEVETSSLEEVDEILGVLQSWQVSHHRCVTHDVWVMAMLKGRAVGWGAGTGERGDGRGGEGRVRQGVQAGTPAGTRHATQ